jgi:hypothetical protein
MGFGVFYLLACSGALVELYRVTTPVAPDQQAHAGESRFLRVYLVAMAVLAWLAVLTGAYIIYPWYRATAPAGTADLTAFPQLLLQSRPSTAEWHAFGMEWKEHVAWLAPMSITMVAAVFIAYGRDLRRHRGLRAAVLAFTIVSCASAGVTAFFGAMINKAAPTRGGGVVHVADGR